MTPPRPLPCGAWPSPLSPEISAAAAVSPAHAGAAGGTLYWVADRIFGDTPADAPPPQTIGYGRALSA